MWCRSSQHPSQKIAAPRNSSRRVAKERLTPLDLQVTHRLSQGRSGRERKAGILFATECGPKGAERGSIPVSSERLRDQTNRLSLVLLVLRIFEGHRFDKRRDRSLCVGANVAEGSGRGRNQPAGAVVGVECNYTSLTR